MEITTQIKTFIMQNYAIDVAIENNYPEIILQANYPIAFLKPVIEQQFPAVKINIIQNIPVEPTQLTGLKLANVKNAIAVVSGKGGVGKSTISCNLAIALQQIGAQVGLLDADIYGPSIPTMMGIDSYPEINDHNMFVPPRAYNVACMSMGLLQKETPLIWRGPMLAKTTLQLIDKTAWSNLDYLIIDLPPGTGDIPLSLVQKIPLSGAVIVTTPQTIATLDAEKAIQMFLKTHVPIIGIVNNMAWYECQNCHDKHHIFGQNGAQELAKKYNLPILCQIPLITEVRHGCDIGKPSAAQPQVAFYDLWQKAALNVAISLHKKN